MPQLGKLLLVLGLAMAAVGVLLLFQDKLPFRLPFGRLPGDIAIQRPGFSFHFPWVSCLVISVVVSLVLWFFRR